MRKCTEIDKKKGLYWLPAAGLLLWTLFIWGNSLLSGPVSMEKSQSVINVVKPSLYFLGIPVELWQFFVRKTAHFLEFFLLGVLWFWNLQRRISQNGRRMTAALTACFLTAGIDELLQSFCQRTSQFRDVCLDTLGALTGIVICSLITRIFRHGKK